MNQDQLSVQMYTLRSIAADDFDAALKAVAEIGYKNVETAGLQGLTAIEFKELLDRYGLKAPSAHVPYEAFEADVDAVIEDYKTIGAEWLIVPAPPLERLFDGAAVGWGDLGGISAHQLSTLDGDEMAAKFTLSEKMMQEFCANLVKWAEACDAAGVRFGYHNHHFEYLFKMPDGTSMYDYMLQNSPIIFEIDAFWAMVGGKDPVEVIKANPDRVALVHLKDGSEALPGKDVAFGLGVMDWDGIIAAADEADCEYYVVELDNPDENDPVKDVKTSYDNAMERMAE